MCRTIINVDTGQLKCASGNSVLEVLALGSCIAVCVIDVKRLNACLAHIMLPGKAPANSGKRKNKYSENALDGIFKWAKENKISKGNIKIFIVGGGNVLKREGDNIAHNNIEAVIRGIKQRNMKITAQLLGGTVRRSIKVDMKNRKIFCVEGDSGRKITWQI